MVDEALEREKKAIVTPVLEETSSGGGTEALANEEAGYFDNINLTEEK